MKPTRASNLIDGQACGTACLQGVATPGDLRSKARHA